MNESTNLPTAIITGAGSGIGRATARLFVAHGINVIGNGRRLEKLQETAALCNDSAGRFIPVAGDVGDARTAEELVKTAVAAGAFRYLINNAGVGWNLGIEDPGSMGALLDTAPEQWREVMRINLDSVYLLSRRALQHFVQAAPVDGERGSIVNVASGGGLRGMDDAHGYATAKAGVVNLTRSLARAYGPQGIRSNVIAPGFVDTDMVASVLSSEMNPFADEALRYQVSPLGRPGKVDEIAQAIYFLAVQGTYCNGAILTADGGSLA